MQKEFDMLFTNWQQFGRSSRKKVPNTWSL